MTRPLDDWILLVRSNVRLKDPGDALPIAQACLDAETANQPHSVWHMTASYYGYPCHCARCEPPMRFKPPSRATLRRALASAEEEQKLKDSPEVRAEILRLKAMLKEKGV